MAEIIHFVACSGLKVEENLKAFVKMCREQLTVFGETLRFEENVWDVSKAVERKARRSATRVVFSNWANVNERVISPMTEPFLSFAKAYVRYQHAMRPTTSIGPRIAALRALEHALAEHGSQASPVCASPEKFDRAAQLIQERFLADAAYRTGGQLEMLAGFMLRNQLLTVPVAWRNPIRRPRDKGRIGKEFDEVRHAKLPSPAALTALAKTFRLATEPSDVLVSSVVAILCCMPSRINEVLQLKANCEVAQRISSTKEIAYGIRWPTSKGAAAMIKWVVASMEDVAREALKKIRKLTDQARKVASWCAAHKGRLYLPPEIEHLRERACLTMVELSDVLFTESAGRSAGLAWCQHRGIKTAMKDGRRVVAFADVEAAVWSMQPQGFPIANVKRALLCSDALCLVLRNTLSTRPTYRGVVQLLSVDDVGSRLGARKTSGIPSIFERMEFTEENGDPIKVTTHQFRHYLNTLAQTGGLSQLDIAKWSGRVDINQNNAYDHQSDRDVLALVRNVVGDSQRMFGPLARLPGIAPIPRDQFAQLKVRTAHTTEFGYCIHDFTMLPCQIHRDCVNCDEQVCIKGDSVREGSIRKHRAETRALLLEAEEAAQEKYAGSNRWIDHQRATLARLDQLCQILDDPSVPLGAVIQLSGVVPASRLAQADRGRIGNSEARLLDEKLTDTPQPLPRGENGKES
jgi:hypothetical protein